ncbi:MAG: PBP1A family penicillin-binding protein [Chitinivibrionia bacterium]|nr:PBP1A family penicillin-binding protein [Chitinivibrionia bacterium]
MHWNKETVKLINLTPLVLVIMFAVILFLGATITATVVFLNNVYKTIPEPHELGNIQPSLVTRVYAKDSSLIHEFSIERRFWVPIDSVPQVLIDAIISIEDRRFYSHWGFDSRRMVQAIIGNAVSGRIEGGASTITMQLARNVFLTQRQTAARKMREILTAIQLEKYYTKDEILEMYLNKIYLGGGNFGMSAAAMAFFSKNIQDIDLNEAAVLAGTVQTPNRLRPNLEGNHERLTARRRTVLNSMVRAGAISRAEADSVSALPIPNNPHRPVSTVAPYFVEQIRRDLERRFGSDMLYNAGLSIFTTLDPQAQTVAEEAMNSHLTVLQRRQNAFFIDNAKAYEIIGVRREVFMRNFDSIYAAHAQVLDALHDSISLRKLQGSVISMDVETGAVRVMIGGRDFTQSRFNRATQGFRQPGSAFKPFIFAAAFDNGFTPASVVVDRPITIGDWRPENIGREFFGDVTIRQALRRSLNMPAIIVAMEVGLRNVVDLAKAMGFSRDIRAVPALALGVCDVSNLELTRAFAAFANQGLMPQQYFVEMVKDRNGRVIFRHEPRSTQVIDPALASLLTHTMQDVVIRGTGASIRHTHNFMRPSAGKTGTTNNFVDAWYIGYTPQISTGVWVGTDRSQTMGQGVTGSSGAIPIWAPVMHALHRDLPVAEFVYASEGLITLELCPVSNERASIRCPNPYQEMFLIGTVPPTCNVHGASNVRDAREIFGTQPTHTPATPSGGVMF